MAKFKVGDKVKYVGHKYGAPYGKVLTIVKEPDKIGRYVVRWDSDHGGFMAVGSEGFATEAELIAANAARSRNAVVQKALSAVARNGRAIPVDSKGKGIIERCKIRTADGEVAEVAHIDEDGFVYFKAKDGRIRGVSADTVTRLNADTSVLRETAVNGVWETEGKLEREIARAVGADIDVGIYGSAIAIGGVPDEASAGKVKDIVARIFGPVASWQVKKDIIGYTIHAKVAKPMPTNASRTTNAVVAKALNARRVARNEHIDDATARRDIEQSLRKMAELAAMVSRAKATSRATHDDYYFAGYIDLAFPDKGAADNFNPYDVIYALRDARSLVPKWAWGVGGFNYERNGNSLRIHIGRFAT